MTDNILLMLHPADPERPGSIMTVHLMDILVQFLPEYDHYPSQNDKQVKCIWQRGLVHGSKWQIEGFMKSSIQIRRRNLWLPWCSLNMLVPQISNILIYWEYIATNPSWRWEVMKAYIFSCLGIQTIFHYFWLIPILKPCQWTQQHDITLTLLPTNNKSSMTPPAPPTE